VNSRRDFRALDDEWLVQPYRDHDMRAFDRIVEANFRIVQSNGATLSKSEKRADVLGTPILGPDSPFSIADQKLDTFGDVAISRGALREVKSTVFYTNTYEHQPDGWHVVASQLTRGPRQ
jgi:hypothetical protein